MFAETQHSLLMYPGMLILLTGLAFAIYSRKKLPASIAALCLADIGYLLVALGCGTGFAYGSALLHLIYTGIARILCVICAMHLCKTGSSVKLESLTGIGRKAPLSALLFAFAMFASLGISPFMTPDAKPFMLFAAFSSGSLFAGGFLTLSSAVMSILTVLLVHRIWLGDGKSELRFASAEDQASGTGKPARSSLASVTPLQGIALALTAALALAGLFGHHIFLAAAELFTGNTPLPELGADWEIAALIPYTGAFIVWAVGASGKCWSHKLRNLLSCLFMAAAFCIVLFPEYYQSIGLSFLPETYFNPFGRLFAIIVTGIGLLVTLYSCSYIHSGNGNAYFFFLLLTFGSLTGIAASHGLGSFYAFWEIMTLASYVLVAYEGTAKAHAAAIKYYIMCASSAALMLGGFMYLGAEDGSVSFAALGLIAGSIPPAAATAVAVLSLIGFGVKAGLVPGHFWLPDAHPAAPSSVSAPLSGVLTKAGIFGLIAVVLGIFGTKVFNGSGTSMFSFGGLVTTLGIVTMLFGEIMALRQRDLKRLFAYSTMGQIGEITMTLGLFTYLSVNGALLHAVNHSIMKDLLFLCSGVLILRAGSRNLADLRGLGKAMPVTATCMVIGLLSIMGLPPFAGFSSKFLMLHSMAQTSYWMIGVLLLGSLAGCVYYTRIIRTLIFEPYTGPAVKEAPLAMRIPLIILTFLVVLFGLCPELPLKLVVAAANTLTDAGNLARMRMPSLHITWNISSVILMCGAIAPILLRKSPRMAGNATCLILGLAFAGAILSSLYIGVISIIFAIVITGMGWLNMRYAIGYMEHGHSQWRFYASFLFMTGGLMGVACANDLLSFFFFWEIMSSWSLYFLIVHEENPTALREGFKYFFFNVLGASFIFVGVAMAINLCGSASFNIIATSLTRIPSLELSIIIGSMAIGFIMKAAQLPFRIDVQMHPSAAPTPVSGYISSVLLKSALFGLFKLIFVIGGESLGTDVYIMMKAAVWIGGITIVMAAAFAVFQKDIKMVLIYSTVSQLGYMVAGIALGSSLGIAGGLLHLLNHVLFKDLLFLVAGAIIVQTHRNNINEMGGIANKMPYTFAMFCIGTLCVIGLPPSNGFTSKWILYHALMDEGYVVVAIMSLLGSVLTLAYFARMAHIVFLGQPAPNQPEIKEAPTSMLFPMGLLTLGCVITSVFPGLLLTPVNLVLFSVGKKTLPLAPWGIATGAGAWNATLACILVMIAAGAGIFILKRFGTAKRISEVHTCGIPLDELNLHSGTEDIYSTAAHVFTPNKK